MKQKIDSIKSYSNLSLKKIWTSKWWNIRASIFYLVWRSLLAKDYHPTIFSATGIFRTINSMIFATEILREVEFHSSATYQGTDWNYQSNKSLLSFPWFLSASVLGALLHNLPSAIAPSLSFYPASAPIFQCDDGGASISPPIHTVIGVPFS